jgi:ribonuclease VapC
MVLDTSVILAILQDEPERVSFSQAIDAAEARLMSAASLLESSMIIEFRYGAEGVRDLDFLIAKARISIEPVDEEQARIARQGFRKFGKGRHPASLNFGDFFSYALSQSRGVPLLFKGDDFSLSDVECHPASR